MNKSDSIIDCFEAQKKHQFVVGSSSLQERKNKLKKLKNAVENTFREAIREALWLDFHKSAEEVDLSEIYVITSEIKHALHHLGQWVKPQKVGTPLAMLGSSSHIRYEPKGVCLLISPWNFPFNLTFGPLVCALAAGNTVIIKPSEITPHCSAVIKELIESLFDSNEVAVFEGDVAVSSELLALPFNHIFFTGSPAVGKVVMAAAAKNLASVTLELGGKSPTIVDQTADLKATAKRLAWGKFFNSGQVCIAPDYLWVHQSVEAALVEEIKKVVNGFFGEKAYSKDFTHLVNAKHTARLKNLLDDAVAKGATVLMGGQVDTARNFIPPTLLGNVPLEAAIMEQEIFGPILPIIPFFDLSEVCIQLSREQKPLALYIFSSSRKNIDFLLKNTRAGGTCINNNAVHFFNNNLPFGGSNNSGIGKAHGFFGFQEFSNARGIMQQHLPGALELLMPPYTALKTKLIALTVKYF
jgi:aldehyde dehydrogenase (NAD+)